MVLRENQVGSRSTDETNLDCTQSIPFPPPSKDTLALTVSAGWPIQQPIEASVGTYTLFAATVDRLAIPSGVEHDLSGLNRLQGPKMFDAVVW
ncbi:hypothetical protein T265_15264, partial [Opisthorchis viverrini]